MQLAAVFDDREDVWSPQSRAALVRASPFQPVQLAAARAVLAAPDPHGPAAGAALERLRAEVAASAGELARARQTLLDLRSNIFYEVDQVRGGTAPTEPAGTWGTR